ncbi:MAG TPA: pyridoxamine 5'-phosphate oxidase family protein [Streptosporangiaceae bacterium]|nr:pyridoxamine 5'-phosphate oxidase family protein [Streptosporangiaceae bacterium]
MNDERSLLELSRADGWRLLASVPVGRLVFTHQALPAVRLVNHLVDGDTIVVGLTPGSAIATSAGTEGTVVAYEADELDLAERLGWSVVVVGVARLVADDAAVAQYRRRLRPWLSGAMAEIMMISSEVVTGYRLVQSEPGSKIARAAV